MPTVTVTVCAYNGEQYVRAAIDSILAQTFRDFELVVVDDASTDGTTEILKQYDDPRIQLLHNAKNLGPTRSFNRAWRAGTAPYVAHQDADDCSLPQRLELQVKYLDSHPEVGLLGSSAEIIDEEGTVKFVDRFPCGHEELRAGLVTDCIVHHSTIMYRRALMERLNGYDESFYFAQDFDLQWRMTTLARFECLPKTLIQYRVGHSSQISKHWAREQREYAHRIALRNLQEYMADEAFDEQAGMRFYAVLHGQAQQWRIGDALRLRRLWKKLLRDQASRTVWVPRLMSVIHGVAERAPWNAHCLSLVIAVCLPLRYIRHLGPAFLRSSLKSRQRATVRGLVRWVRTPHRLRSKRLGHSE